MQTLETTVAPTTLDDLVLVRYLVAQPTPTKVRADVGKLLGITIGASEFDAVRADLTNRGFLGRGKQGRHALTADGRSRALRFLGLADIPARATWSSLVGQYLFPQAVGLTNEAAAKLKDAKTMRAFLVKRKYNLPSGTPTTPQATLEALACQQLGYPGETSLQAVLCLVLSKMLKQERLTKDELAQQVPLYQTELPKADANAIRQKMVRDWLKGHAPARNDQPEPFDLHAFAATVLALARKSPPMDRYYETKVFIVAVWRASQAEPNFPRLTLAEFKAHLLHAHVQNLLSLVRADLVSAMDPQLVAESELAYRNATFHFILLE